MADISKWINKNRNISNQVHHVNGEEHPDAKYYKKKKSTNPDAKYYE